MVFLSIRSFLKQLKPSQKCADREAFHYEHMNCSDPYQDWLEHDISPCKPLDKGTTFDLALKSIDAMSDLHSEAIKINEAFDLLKDTGIEIWPVNKPEDKVGVKDLLIHNIASCDPICCCDYPTCDKEAKCPGSIDNTACEILQNWHTQNCKHNVNIQ